MKVIKLKLCKCWAELLRKKKEKLECEKPPRRKFYWKYLFLSHDLLPQTQNIILVFKRNEFTNLENQSKHEYKPKKPNQMKAKRKV